MKERKPPVKMSMMNLLGSMVPDQIAKMAKQLFGQRTYNATKRMLLGGQEGDRLGPLRRVTRIYPDAGFTRGEPIGRFYTNRRFLPAHASDVHGHVLEISESVYTRWFGKDRVTKSDVLHITPGHPGATIIADLTKADHIPSETFDCIIITFTLQFIYDIKAAIRTLCRILKPGGVVLAVFDSTSRVSRADMDIYGEYWRVTTASARRLFEECFPPDGVTVKAYGNALSVVASLHGLVSDDFFEEELDYHDPDIEMVIAVRAVKPLSSV